MSGTKLYPPLITVQRLGGGESAFDMRFGL